MSSMSIPSSIRVISTKLPQLNLFPYYSSSSLKPLISSLSPPCSVKSISFQRLPIKPLKSSSSSSSSSVNSKSKSIDEEEQQQEQHQEVPPKLQEIIKLFQSAEDPRSKYQQLMFYANKLPPLEAKYKTNENKVEGCVSQVWVRAFLDPHNENENENVVLFEADSDSIMTKGLAALLVLGLSGSPLPHILTLSPDFITLLGLQQNLTPSRNNGFLNMFKLMQKKALYLALEAQNKHHYLEPNPNPNPNPKPQGEDIVGTHTNNSNSNNNGSSGVGVGAGGASGSFKDAPLLGTRGERIREILERELKPVQLELEDISYQHAGHVGVKGSEGETHFNLNIVSNEFQGKSLVKRHRIIYDLLQSELEGGLHALSIIAKTPAEVQEGSYLKGSHWSIYLKGVV